jgi:hypothetical protein
VTAFTESQGGVNKSDVFILHLLIINTTVATWRRYLIFVAEEVRKQVSVEAGES